MNASLIQSELLRVFHDTVRLVLPPEPAGHRIEHVGLVRRQYTLDPSGFATVETPEGLGADPAALIARERDYFAGRGQELEWKTYDYDEPAGLADLLLAAGFVENDDEALILGETAPLAEQEIDLPEGLVVRAVEDKADFDRIRALYRDVWGQESPWIGESLFERWRDHPPTVDVIVVEQSREGPVLCSARSEYDESPFVGLWGGSTDPAWRGRGLYRTTLLHRARLALERAKPYVRVDASPDSEPILRRLGLHRVATTTPYAFHPQPREGGD